MNNTVSILLLHEKASLPLRASEHAAGYDVAACLDAEVRLAPGERALIPTGLSFAIPPAMEIQVRPRSGLALKNGVTLVNSPGTIDSDYRGEVKVILINHGNEVFVISPGMRIAQLVFAPVLHPDFQCTTALHDSERGGGGFGHTGV